MIDSNANNDFNNFLLSLANECSCIIQKNPFYTFLQMIWIIFHVARLLFIVEPCHLVATEVSFMFSVIELNLGYGWSVDL